MSAGLSTQEDNSSVSVSYRLDWNTLEDVEREFPGELEKILVWFRDYKMPDGKPANEFGYDNKCLDKDFALDVIKETHEFWNKLKSGARENTEGLALE